MAYRVTVQPANFSFETNPDETLLEAALRQGLSIPYGCKNGACGACVGQVKSGKVDLGAYQSYALSQTDIAQGNALFCCAKAKSDLVVDHPELTQATGNAPKILQARIETMDKVAPDVIVLNLRLPATEKFVFRAGQYIDFLLPDGKRRSYSIASSPEQTEKDNLLELHIRHVPDGSFTRHVFEAMKPKDLLRIEGPHGHFFLREETEKPLILLASGTGFAPIASIIEHMLAKGMTRPAHLYWGCRKTADLYKNGLANRWAENYPHIRYTPVLSEPEESWQGKTGFVHKSVMDDYPDLFAHQVYACGSPLMVEAARKDFAAHCHLPEQEFFADAFTPATFSGKK